MKKGIIDRYEGEWGIVEWEDKSTQSFNRHLFPPEARAGDVVRIQSAPTVTIEIDKQATQQRKERIEKLMDDVWLD